jgi:transposase
MASSYHSTVREEAATKITTLEERLQTAGLAGASPPAPAIVAQTGWSLVTVRKWQRRIREQGRSVLTSVLGRPRQGP